MYIDIDKLIEEKIFNIKEELEILKEEGKKIKLAVIIANDEESSKVYVSSKRKMCESLGIEQEEYFLKNEVTTDDVIKLVESLNNDKSVTSILLQLPIYSHLDTIKIIEKISCKKDVDGFTSQNLGKLVYMEKSTTIPCTPKGIMSIFEYLDIDLKGKNVTVVGRSNIVGKPLSIILVNSGATVTVCNSNTNNLKQKCIGADILVVAVGQAGIIKKDMVKKDAIIIDVGINKDKDGNIVGDVSKEAKDITYSTKVPGGVGKMTVISLIENIIKNAKEV